ncbi:MAG TPA: alpha-amylase family glycosyl hydrolase [Stellaceae bacterium]|jgi:1,4-alpha-glucan branching enzyme
MPINPNEAGAFSSTDAAGNLLIKFGLYLPGIRKPDGFEVVVRIIHRDDRFDPAVPPVDVPMAWQQGSSLDLWSAEAKVTPGGGSPGRFGSEGTYLYRYQLSWTPPGGGTPQLVTRWFTDPFARQAEIGRLAAVTVTRNPVASFAWSDNAWRTPELDDLIVYELQVEQFNDTFGGIVDRLDYLKSLGVNCLELMPVTSTKLDFDWGYGPVHYWAPHAAFGGEAGLKRLVDSCHARGVAVILDVVYQHVDPFFPYCVVYQDLRKLSNAPRIDSPMIDGDGPFGPMIDFSRTFAQEFCRLANRHWLDEYHVDGFRYDEVTDLYQGPTDTAYAMLAYETYRYSRGIDRFGCGPGTYSRIIQCAEALGRAPEVLRNTYTNSAWQDDLLNRAENIARGDLSAGSLSDLAHLLDPFFAGRYPNTKTAVDSADQNVEMPVAPFQYISTHDHSNLISFAGTSGTGPLPEGDRSQFFKLQPLLIALYTSQGVPMLWEGEEFADNYTLPGDGLARVHLRRDVHWEYFYDDYGTALIRLCRILGRLRTANRALRSRESYFYYQQSLAGNTIVAYHRHAPAAGPNPEQYAIVALNFGSEPSSINLPFPKAGNWIESVDGGNTLTIASNGAFAAVTVPPWYGFVFLH